MNAAANSKQPPLGARPGGRERSPSPNMSHMPRRPAGNVNVDNRTPPSVAESLSRIAAALAFAGNAEGATASRVVSAAASALAPDQDQGRHAGPHRPGDPGLQHGVADPWQSDLEARLERMEQGLLETRQEAMASTAMSPAAYMERLDRIEFNIAELRAQVARRLDAAAQEVAAARQDAASARSESATLRLELAELSVRFDRLDRTTPTPVQHFDMTASAVGLAKLHETNTTTANPPVVAAAAPAHPVPAAAVAAPAKMPPTEPTATTSTLAVPAAPAIASRPR